LFDVTIDNHFFALSVPAIESLDLAAASEGSAPRTVVIGVAAEVVGRCSFGLCVAPEDSTGHHLGDHVRIAYPRFCLYVYAMRLPFEMPDNMDKHFVYAAPAHGTKPNQSYSPEEAELAYYKRNQGEIIVYPPDQRGVYTMHTAAVMRRTPRLTIGFKDPKFEAIAQSDSRPHRVRFRVRGPGGYITDTDMRPLIQSIELDSEL
jgi:hypothetical protein